jgi:hypothetical protein
MLKNGTKVQIYEDPITRLKFEGEAVILSHESTLSDGLELYWVRFNDAVDKTASLRKVVESVAKEHCKCFECPGDNPECKVHARQMSAEILNALNGVYEKGAGFGHD